MPKGKKFNAAERHFREKEAGYRKEIRDLKSLLCEKDRAISALKSTALDLNAKNHVLEAHVERLLEYAELDRADIKAACRKDKELANVLSAMSKISDLFC